MADRTYTGEEFRYDSGASIHPIHTGRFFTPHGARPPGGWPCVVVVNYGGFQSSTVGDTLAPVNGVPYRLIHELRLAVFWAHLPPSRSDVLPGLTQKAQDPGDFNPNVGELGAAYLGNGVGVVHTGEVGSGWPGPNPSGYVGTHPWLDPLWVMPEKAATYAVQFLRENAATLGGGLNAERLGMRGVSAGAYSIAFPTFMPDMAGELGDVTSQGMQSTEVKATVLQGMPSYWNAYLEAAPGPRAYHLPDKSGVWDEPADRFGDAYVAVRFGLSVAGFASPLGEQPGLVAAKSGTAVFMRYGETPHQDVLDTPGRYNHASPSTWPTDAEDAPHSTAQGYLMRSLWRDHANVTLHLTNPDGVDPTAEVDGLGVAADRVVETAAQTDDEEMGFWSSQLLAGQEPIKEQILDRLEETLRAISVSNGYQSDVQQVIPVDVVPEGHPMTYPSILTGDGDDVPGAGFGPGIRERSLTVRLVCMVAANVNYDGRRARNRLVADAIKALEGNWHASRHAGPAGVPTAANPFADLPVTDVQETSTRAFSAKLGEDETLGAEVVIQVDYRVSLLDPYQVTVP